MISEYEWTYLEKIMKFLKNFKCISKILGSKKTVTLPIVIVACSMLIDKIESIIFELDNKPDRSSIDETLLLSFQAGRDTILKHYNKYNWIYCVSLIVDPRHMIECFNATQWGRELKEKTIKKFEQIYKEQYYVEPIATEAEEYVISQLDENMIDVKSLYLTKNQTIDSWRDEIDRYVQAPRATSETDILQWWKIHCQIYPNLSRMARDILSTLASSVPVERMFSEGSLIMTNKRASLKNEPMKALICTNSWVKSSLCFEICGVDFN